MNEFIKTAAAAAVGVTAVSLATAAITTIGTLIFFKTSEKNIK